MGSTASVSWVVISHCDLTESYQSQWQDRIRQVWQEQVSSTLMVVSTDAWYLVHQSKLSTPFSSSSPFPLNDFLRFFFGSGDLRSAFSGRPWYTTHTPQFSWVYCDNASLQCSVVEIMWRFTLHRLVTTVWLIVALSRNSRSVYRVDGDDVIRSTDEWLFLVDVDDDVLSTNTARHSISTSSTTSSSSASSSAGSTECLWAGRWLSVRPWLSRQLTRRQL